MTTYHKWTDTENDYIRCTYNKPASKVATDLGLSVSKVRDKRATLRKQDEAERFAHAVEQDLKEIKAFERFAHAVEQDLKEIEVFERKVNASARPVNIKKYPLNSSEMDGKLKQFRLFEGVYPEPVDVATPSLWQRIKAFFTRG